MTGGGGSGAIVITGAAGLVGQNLIVRMLARGLGPIIAIDKHPANTATLRRLHPAVTVIEADLARDDGWQASLAGARALVIGHAQIGGLDPDAFEANNVRATERLMAAAISAGIPYQVHISSSVVKSAAVDWYTETKKRQEQVVVASGLPTVVLRPTLMFGWFDRKHLGWLARFMRRVPVFPIPGHGRYRRQPLYVGDFCAVILSCLERSPPPAAYDISGLETLDYIDLMAQVRDAARARARILRIPFGLFWLLLTLYGWIDRNPPFTTRQLKALAIPELFPVIDWPGQFGVRPTPLAEALTETFQAEPWAAIELAF